MIRFATTVFLAWTSFNMATARVHYDGYKVYQVEANTEDHNQFLLSLGEDRNYNFWSSVNKIGRPVSVMVAPEAQDIFEQQLTKRGIKHSIQIPDVETTVQREREYHESRPEFFGGKIAFDQYLRHAEINNYLQQLSGNYSNLVKTEVVGRSYEGRNLITITISTGGTGTEPPKPVIFVDAGIHAREWIAPATALYLINQLVENPDNRALIENVDWVILPVLNPDGYEYTFTNARMWRKTRTPGFICDGVDGNRNFEVNWSGTGSSTNECSETFAGPDPFSEVESRILRNLLNSITNIKLYLTLHSYGQLLLHPWGFTTDNAANYPELQEIGLEAAAAIAAVNGTSYRVGSTMGILYAASGITTDWAAAGAGIDLAYTIELPGGGAQGFDLPPERIKPVVEETFEAFKIFHKRIAAKK